MFISVEQAPLASLPLDAWSRVWSIPGVQDTLLELKETQTSVLPFVEILPLIPCLLSCRGHTHSMVTLR